MTSQETGGVTSIRRRHFVSYSRIFWLSNPSAHGTISVMVILEMQFTNATKFPPYGPFTFRRSKVKRSMKIQINNVISYIVCTPGAHNVHAPLYTSHTKNSNAAFRCIERTAQPILGQEAIVRVPAFSIVLGPLGAGPGLAQGGTLSLENILTSSAL